MTSAPQLHALNVDAEQVMRRFGSPTEDGAYTTQQRQFPGLANFGWAHPQRTSDRPAVAGLAPAPQARRATAFLTSAFFTAVSSPPPSSLTPSSLLPSSPPPSSPAAASSRQRAPSCAETSWPR